MSSEDRRPRTYHVGCEVDPNRSGWTLLRFLTRRFRYLDEERWATRVRSGAVTVNDEPARADHRLQTGDRVGYVFEHLEPEVDRTVEVLHEDDELFVVSKSGNIPVHAGGKYIDHTLVAHLRSTGRANLWPVHRLDRETSGVVLFAKSKTVAAHLHGQFEARSVAKRYVAILRGCPPHRFLVDAPVGRNPEGVPPFFIVRPEGVGKSASSRFRRLSSDECASFYEVVPVEGRTNQIRVHAAHAGHPIVGDKIYGIRPDLAARFVSNGPDEEIEAAAGAERHMLHCSTITIRHPRHDRAMTLHAPLPGDFRAAAGELLQTAFS